MHESAAEWVTILPWLLPVTAAFVLGAAWASGPVARVLRTRPFLAAVLMISVGIVVGATLTPLGDAAGDSTGERGCDLSRLTLASLGDLRRLNDAALNVVLFVPLGGAIGLVGGIGWSRVLVAAVALPFAIEILQLTFPLLGRGCQSADVIDNLSGLFVGFVGGSIARAVRRWIGRGGPSS